MSSEKAATQRGSAQRTFRPIRRRIRNLAVLAGWLTYSFLHSSAPLSAQAIDVRDPGQALTQYRLDVWKTEQGLPLNTVQSLLHTSDGYLWIGTGGGLARFDGIRFVTFAWTGMPEIASQPIYGLAQDKQGTLWIGHAEGVVTYRDGVFRRVLNEDVTEGRRVWAFAQADDGSMWIASEAGLIHWNGQVEKIYGTSDGLPTTRLRSVAFDRDGVLWIGTTGGGLVSFDGSGFRTFAPGDGFPHPEVRSVLPHPEGGVWAATAGGGLAHVSGSGALIRTYTEKDGLPTNQLVALALDRHGSLWIGTWGAGLVRMRDGEFTSISSDDGLAGEQIWSVLADREGSVWVGTWVGGLNRLSDRPFVVLGTPEGLSHDNVRSVTIARDGAAWVTTAGGGLNRIRNGNITHYTTEDGLPSNETSCVYEDRGGTLWVGTYTGGLARMRGARFEAFGPESGLPHIDVRAIYQDSGGTLWVGTALGLARFDGTRFTPVAAAGMRAEAVISILQDRSGTLWFGTAGEGLLRFENGRYDRLTREHGLVSNWIMALHEDAEGTLWIGTNGEGMNRYRDGQMRAITTEDGLWDPIVQAILQDALGNLWITCNRGFFSIPLEQLNALAEGRRDRVESRGFGPGHALRSTTFAGGHQPAGAVDQQGHLWLPSFSGLVIVDPAELPGTERPPTVRFEEVTVNGERMRDIGQVILPPGGASLSIRYTAATLQNSDRVRFRYLMEGASREWVDAGTSREAFFPALPHGDYRFRVAASLDGRHWAESASALPIVVKPRFFQTPWFFALVAIAFVAATALVLRIRTRNLSRQKDEMERLIAEKTEELRLANEHLARLSFVDSLTGLANRRRFDAALADAWERASRTGESLAVLVADVDLFKPYNDTLGHPEGDRCLAAVADVFREVAGRSGNLVARYGGEEFVVLLRDTSVSGATKLAEQLRAACEARRIPHPASSVSRYVTISLGVAATQPSPGVTDSELVEEADAALYRAKRDGRNRVCTSEPSERVLSSR